MNQDPKDAERERIEWEALSARFPMSHPASLAVPLLSALAANATLCWLVATRALSPLELVLIVVLETLLFVLAAWAQHALVPRAAHLEGKHMGLGERLGLGVFALVWLGGVYGFVLFLWLGQAEQAAALIADPLGFLGQSRMWLPLAISAVGAVLDALLDWRHWRRHGGKFVSTPAMTGAARWLTLFLGGIPFAMPLFLIVAAFSKLIELFQKRAGASSLLPMVLVPVLILSVFGTFGWLVQSGVSGFAIGYTIAKLAADSLIVFMPWIGHIEKNKPAEGLPEPRKKGVLPG